MLSDIFGSEGDEASYDASGGTTASSGGPSVPEARRSSLLELSGLKNQGGTCYLNSVLQVLFFLPEFRSKVYQAQLAHLVSLDTETQPENPEDGKNQGEGGKSFLSLELQELFARMELSNVASNSTLGLTQNAFNWQQGQSSTHHDVHELVTKLLERLHAEHFLLQQGQPDKQEKDKSSSSMVKQLFIGSAKENEVRCIECGYTSGAETPFMSIFATVQGFNTLEESLFAQYKGPPERLEGSNAYNCEGCSRVTGKELAACLKSIPPCLFINLNRFAFDFNTLRRVKVSTKFEFPVHLDMAQFLRNPPENENMIYDLVAIITHAGSGYAGHYICYIRTDILGASGCKGNASKEDSSTWKMVAPKNKGKNSKNKKPSVPNVPNADEWGEWFKFNDTVVHKVRTEELAQTFVGRSCAYMLLYKSRDSSQGGVMSREAIREMIPQYWRDKIEKENRALDTVWEEYLTAINSCEIGVFQGSDLKQEGPHLVLASPASQPRNVAFDERLSVQNVFKSLCSQHGETPSTARLFLLAPHGPGYYASLEVSNHVALLNLSLKEALESAGVSGTPLLLFVSSKEHLYMLPEPTKETKPIIVSVQLLTKGLKEGQVQAEALTLYASSGTSAAELRNSILETLASTRDSVEFEDRNKVAVRVCRGEAAEVTDISAFGKAGDFVQLGQTILVESWAHGRRDLAAAFIEQQRRSFSVPLSLSAVLRTTVTEGDSSEQEAQEMYGTTYPKIDPIFTEVGTVLHDAARHFGLPQELEARLALFDTERPDALVDFSQLVTDSRLELGLASEAAQRACACEKTAASGNTVPASAKFKCCLVLDNDPSQLKLGAGDKVERSETFFVEIPSNATVSDLKALILKEVSLPEMNDPAAFRIRLTNWAEEPQDVLSECRMSSGVFDGNAPDSVSFLVKDPVVLKVAREMFDEEVCKKAFVSIGGDPAALGSLAWSASWADFAAEETQIETPEGTFRKWWDTAPVIPSSCSVHDLTIRQVYQDLGASELVILERGLAPPLDGLDVELLTWDSGAGTTHKLLCLRLASSLLGTHHLGLVLCKVILLQVASRGMDPSVLFAAMALASIEQVYLRELREESPCGPLPGLILDGKMLQSRAKKGVSHYPFRMVIHASNLHSTRRAGGNKKTKSVPQVSVWLVQRSGDDASSASYACPMEVVFQRKDISGNSLVEAVAFAKGLDPLDIVVAKHDPVLHKWHVFLFCEPSEKDASADASSKTCKTEKSKKKPKGAKIKSAHTDGDVFAFALKSSFPDKFSTQLQKLEEEKLGAFFDTDADLAGRLEMEESRKRRDGDKSKRHHGAAAWSSTIHEEELRLGATDDFFIADFM